MSTAILKTNQRGAGTTQTRSAHVTAEIRAEDKGDQFQISGYAALFNNPSNDLGGFVETIAPGAFDRALREKQDVRFLLNHSADDVLARSGNATLKLSADAKGLKFAAQLNRKIQRHADIFEACRSGLYNECSFAFTIPAGGQSWSPDGTQRTLKDVDLHDVSLVAFPAYNNTSASARAAATQLVSTKTPQERLAEIDGDYERQQKAHKISMEILADNAKEQQRAAAPAKAEPLSDEELDSLRQGIADHFGKASSHGGLTPKYLLASADGDSAKCYDMDSADLKAVRIKHRSDDDGYTFGDPEPDDDDDEDSRSRARALRSQAQLRFRMEVLAGRR